MRIFRYRPLNSLLFKELHYREVYLATPDELNDPLDLNAQIDFSPQHDNDWKRLCSFLFREAVGTHGAILLTPKIHRQFNDNIETYLRNESPLTKDQPFTKEALFQIIRRFYDRTFSDQSLINPIYGEDLCIAINRACGQIFDNSAVACFSERNDDFLMWSHYASGHAGICLEFEAERKSENICSIQFEFPEPINGEIPKWEEDLSKTQYSTQLPSLPFCAFYEVFCELGNIDLIHLSKSRWHDYAHFISKYFVNKLNSWDSEKEWRIIETHFKKTTPEERIRHYSKEALKGVYFGARTTEATKKRVRQALRWATQLDFHEAIIDGSRLVQFKNIATQ